jgi:hypothetical protein
MQTMVVPALPDLQRQLDAGTTVVPWVLSAFLLAASVATGLFGRLRDMFGKRRMLHSCLVVFGIGTLLAALAYPRLLVDVADHEEHRAENRDQVRDDAAGNELGQHGDVVERRGP